MMEKLDLKQDFSFLFEGVSEGHQELFIETVGDRLLEAEFDASAVRFTKDEFENMLSDGAWFSYNFGSFNSILARSEMLFDQVAERKTVNEDLFYEFGCEDVDGEAPEEEALCSLGAGVYVDFEKSTRPSDAFAAAQAWYQYGDGNDPELVGDDTELGTVADRVSKNLLSVNELVFDPVWVETFPNESPDQFLVVQNLLESSFSPEDQLFLMGTFCESGSKVSFLDTASSIHLLYQNSGVDAQTFKADVSGFKDLAVEYRMEALQAYYSDELSWLKQNQSDTLKAIIIESFDEDLVYNSPKRNREAKFESYFGTDKFEKHQKMARAILLENNNLERWLGPDVKLEQAVLWVSLTILIESGGRENPPGTKYRGLMQLSADKFSADENPADPYTNIKKGCEYLFDYCMDEARNPGQDITRGISNYNMGAAASAQIKLGTRSLKAGDQGFMYIRDYLIYMRFLETPVS